MALNIELQMNTPENVALNTSGVPEYAPLNHVHMTLGSENSPAITVDEWNRAVAEGYSTAATGSNSHAEGSYTKASRDCAHAEGYKTQATNDFAHAEGSETKASAMCSHAEGSGTQATGHSAHVEGYDSIGSGAYSHAEGREAQSSGLCSHAEGYGTIAASSYQHVQGQFNVQDSNNAYAHIVGGGLGAGARKNIHTIDWNGNAMFAGGITFFDSNGNEHTLNEILERLTTLES